MNGAPLLSLAVIVRDEAAALPGLLAGHRDLCDEAVVIDTGSTDGSPDVAAAHGARVGSFAWRDDFAAARNAALDLCRGRWVLVLDADEHIAAADRGRLREVVAGAEPAGLLLPQWNYVDDPAQPGWRPADPARGADARGARGYVVAMQVRLFPCAPDIRYSGRIHETVEPSLRAQGLPQVVLDIPIHHHGHHADAATREARLVRNAALLALKLRENPTDPRSRYEMAVNLVARRRPDLARRLLERLVAEAPDGPRSPDAWRLLGSLASADGRVGDAVVACRRAVTARPDHADGWPDLVRALAAAGEGAAALAALEQFEWLFPGDPRLPGLRAQVQAGNADKG